MDIRKIKKLIELMIESDLQALEVKEGDQSISLTRRIAQAGLAPIAVPEAQPLVVKMPRGAVELEVALQVRLHTAQTQRGVADDGEQGDQCGADHHRGRRGLHPDDDERRHDQVDRLGDCHGRALRGRGQHVGHRPLVNLVGHQRVRGAAGRQAGPVPGGAARR